MEHSSNHMSGNRQSVDKAKPSPPDPYDADNALHIDELPPFNGDTHAEFAFDDEGNRYKVVSGDRFPSTGFIPESQWRENVLPKRDGVGEECVECDETIEWNAIIVNSEYHLRCFVDTETDRDVYGG